VIALGSTKMSLTRDFLLRCMNGAQAVQKPTTGVLEPVLVLVLVLVGTGARARVTPKGGQAVWQAARQLRHSLSLRTTKTWGAPCFKDPITTRRPRLLLFGLP
jgi:hypothetical protein